MKAILFLLFGTVLFFSGIWGGAYLLGMFPYGTWANFPSFATGFVATIAGMVLSGIGIFLIGNKP